MLLDVNAVSLLNKYFFVALYFELEKKLSYHFRNTLLFCVVLSAAALFFLAPYASDALSSYLVTGVTSILPPGKYYVTENGKGDGSSWDSPMGGAEFAETLRKIDGNSGEYIFWVAKGSYLPTSNYDKTLSFKISDGVSIYGGFNGDENFLASRDIAKNPTVFAGNIGDKTTSSDNSLHVLTAENVGNNSNKSLIDGITITGGNALGHTIPRYYGSGMYNKNCGIGLLIQNCTFKDNESNKAYGTLYNDNSSVIVKNSTFENNVAAQASAVYNAGGGARPTFTNCTFANNVTLGSYGAMCSVTSEPKIINCTFVDNKAKDCSGALAFLSMGKYIVVNSIFEGNTTETASSDIYIVGTNSQTLPQIVLLNCAIKPQNIKMILKADIISSDIYVHSPRVSKLAHNGGAVKTVAISAAGSAFSNALSPDIYDIPVDSANIRITVPSDDARGLRRLTSDIGAYAYVVQSADLSIGKDIPTECLPGASFDIPFDVNIFLAGTTYSDRAPDSIFWEVSGDAMHSEKSFIYADRIGVANVVPATKGSREDGSRLRLEDRQITVRVVNPISPDTVSLIASRNTMYDGERTRIVLSCDAESSESIGAEWRVDTLNGTFCVITSNDRQIEIESASGTEGKCSVSASVSGNVSGIYFDKKITVTSSLKPLLPEEQDIILSNDEILNINVSSKARSIILQSGTTLRVTDGTVLSIMGGGIRADAGSKIILEGSGRIDISGRFTGAPTLEVIGSNNGLVNIVHGFDSDVIYKSPTINGLEYPSELLYGGIVEVSEEEKINNAKLNDYVCRNKNGKYISSISQTSFDEEIKIKSSDMRPLELLSVNGGVGGLYILSTLLESGDLPLSARLVGDLKLAKLTKNGRYVELTRVASMSDLSDGRWLLKRTSLMSDGEYVSDVCSGETCLLSSDKYEVIISVLDNGIYDHDQSIGSVLDPAVIYCSASEPLPEKYQDRGCNQGMWGVATIIFLLPAWGMFYIGGKNKKIRK